MRSLDFEIFQLAALGGHLVQLVRGLFRRRLLPGGRLLRLRDFLQGLLRRFFCHFLRLRPGLGGLFPRRGAAYRQRHPDGLPLEDGSINFDELGRIIEDQIARSTDAIVICGTTGECSTMTDEEQLATIKYTVDVVNHRVPVIAGAGSNDTDHGCALAAKSAECGADALLMVTPYYNKTSQAGLVAHFTAMAEAGGIPVIVYNVPSRTGLNIAPETALELSKHPLINGIKEASGNISQVAKIAQLCGDELNIYSGNDDQVVPLLSLGGKGVISVVSNVKPELVHNCCKAFFDGDTAKARQLQLEMLPLADALFCEVNPIPVKYAMNLLGWEAGECRLPLVEPSDAHKEQIEKALRAEGLIKE